MARNSPFTLADRCVGSRIGWLALGVLLAARWSVAAPADVLQALATGTEMPATVSLSSLGDGWLQLRVRTQESFSPLFEYFGRMMTEDEAPSQPYAEQQLFTKGDTVQLGDAVFLVAYQMPLLPLKVMTDSNFEPPMDAEVELTRVLLNLQYFVAINAIQPADRVALQAERAAAIQAFVDTRVQARKANLLSNLRRMAVSLAQYIQDFDEVFPEVTSLDELHGKIEPYVRNEEVFVHPETGEPYRFNMVLSGHKLAWIKYPSEMVMLYEASQAPDGTRGVAYVDGQAKRLTAEEWTRAKRASKIVE